MTATLAGLAIAVVAALLAWARSRVRSADARADRERDRRERAESTAAAATATATLTADQLAADRHGADVAEEIRRAPIDPDPVASVRAVDAAARRVRETLRPGDGDRDPAAMPPRSRRTTGD